MTYHNFVLEHFYKAEPVDYDTVLNETLAFAERLKPLVADVPTRLTELREQGKRLLFEGAQGVLLDIDQGTYPFVTSSNTTAGAVATGSGFGPRYIDYVLGIVKAYTTRVGAGPFPTELHDEIGKILVERGHEFGTTTGRTRRCGWFDAIAVKRAVETNSLSGLCITKLDVLDGPEVVRICIGYRFRGEVLKALPIDAELLGECEPIYEDLEGWSDSTARLQDYNKLPKAAKAYLKSIEALVGAPVDMISTGPDRADIIKLIEI